jgi:hypothetical protein
LKEAAQQQQAGQASRASTSYESRAEAGETDRPSFRLFYTSRQLWCVAGSGGRSGCAAGG